MVLPPYIRRCQQISINYFAVVSQIVWASSLEMARTCGGTTVCCMVVRPSDQLASGNHTSQEVCPGTFMYKIVQALRLYEQIVQQIEDSILKGDLKGGEQLPAERDLAQQFGVSRTAVREAM